MPTFLAGVGLGLTLIVPIGAQNLFVINHGLQERLPRSLWAAMVTACCDTLLIILGALGASALLDAVPAARTALIVTGAVFLVMVGVRNMRSAAIEADVTDEVAPSSTIMAGVGVSLLNPHAILDTVGIIGGAIAAQPLAGRLSFAGGTITASWLWFLALVLLASVLRTRLSPRVRSHVQRGTGALMLVFAGILVLEVL